MTASTNQPRQAAAEKIARPVPEDNAPHVLVIDDDRRIRELLSRYLSEHGYRVSTADNAGAAETRMRGLEFDLLILDVMMPGRSGTDFARALRATSQIPILMLTARAETEHRVEGLQIGVDDYLAKPFDPRELLLRLANILRRQHARPAERPAEVARFADLSFNPGTGELRRGEETIRLTERERDLLQVLIVNAGDTVSRMDLANAGITGSERAVDVQINRLRRKIEADPANPVILQTVRGVGYRLCG